MNNKIFSLATRSWLPASSCFQVNVRNIHLGVGPCYEWSTPQKSNELIPNIAMFKGSYLFQTIILGIHVSFRGCIPVLVMGGRVFFVTPKRWHIPGI